MHGVSQNLILYLLENSLLDKFEKDHFCKVSIGHNSNSLSIQFENQENYLKLLEERRTKLKE